MGNLAAEIPGRLRLRWWVWTRLPSEGGLVDGGPGGVGRLDRYKPMLEMGTWGRAIMPAASRYESFHLAFKHFEEHVGTVVVELGTIRSFVSAGHQGCLLSDPKYWTPDQFENWDWGAGCFSLMAAECLNHLGPMIHTVDNRKLHIERCMIITARYRHLFRYHISDSVAFLDSLPSHSVDLMYLDAGDVDEDGALLQLREAEAIVQRDLLTKNGIILIDDVAHEPTRSDTGDLGKGKYAVPFLLSNGYEIILKGYQYVLNKTSR